jgi:hypothetical protein
LYPLEHELRPLRPVVKSLFQNMSPQYRPILFPKLETATGLQLLEKAFVKVIELSNILGNDAPR